MTDQNTTPVEQPNPGQLSREQVLAAQQLDPSKLFSEEQIREKVRAGLSREQAIEVLTRQIPHDAAIAAEQSNVEAIRAAAKNHVED